MSPVQEALYGVFFMALVLVGFPVCLFTGEIIKDYYTKGAYKNDMARRSHRNPRG